MILEDLRMYMPEYEIKKISDNEYEDLHKLQKTNPNYFSCMQDHEVTMEESIHDTKKLPPDTSEDQKFYIGIFKNGKLEVIMDYIVNYPDIGTIWVGLLMIDGRLKGKGLGKKVMKNFFRALKDKGFRTIQLGVIEMNKEGLPFWLSLDFCEIRRCKLSGEEKFDINVIVMAKAI